jgi:hypothetical protein
MKRDWYTLATWLMWMGLPITALNYWRAWGQLPARMAVHFDANWQPNGYTSREGSLMLGLGIMAVMLVLFTVAASIVRALKPSASWPVLMVGYVVLGFCWYGNHSLVNFNFNAQQPVHSELVGPNSPAISNSDGRTILQLHS